MCRNKPEAVCAFVLQGSFERFDKRPWTLVVPHSDEFPSVSKLQLLTPTLRIFSARRKRLTSEAEVGDSFIPVPLLNTMAGTDASALPCSERVTGFTFDPKVAR